MIKIRPCTEEDLEAVKTLYAEFVAYHASLDSSFTKVKHHAGLFAEYIRENLKNEKSKMLVAETEGIIAGYAFGQIMNKPPVYSSPRYGYVDNLAVTESHQHRGIGEKLFNTLKTWFSEENVDRIEIFAALSNPKSTAFWRKMGFSPYMEQMYLKL